MSKKKGFPVELYVTVENDGNEQFFSAHDKYASVLGSAELFESIPVAKYVLVNVGEATTKVEVKWRRKGGGR